MKKVYSFLSIALFVFQMNILAQVSTTNTCATAYGVTTTSIGSSSVTVGVANTDFSNDYGCISPANNPVWYYFQACASGTISAQVSSYFGSGCDFDFIVWGPLAAPTDCGLTAGQILDCSAAVGIADTMNFPVIAGSYYKFLIANPSNCASSGFTVNFLPPSPIFSDSCYACIGIPIPYQEICQVTNDPIVNRNVIIWEKDTAYTGDYVIQKESTTMGVYITLATVANSDTSAFMDSVSNPAIQAYLYRIATNDTCGNLNITTQPHQTIHLLTSVSSSSGYPQLSWNPYYGFIYGTFYIYRGTSTSTLTLYDSISASFNTYTDIGAIPGLNYYSIAVMPPVPCQPSHTMTKPSFSNTSPVMFTGLDDYAFANFTLGPNPAGDVLNFSFGATLADVRVDIIDITGRIIISRSFEDVNSEMISLNEISNGSYIVRFTTDKGTNHKNIVVAK